MKGLTCGNYASRTGKAKAAVSRGSTSHTSAIITTSICSTDFWGSVDEGEMGGVQFVAVGIFVGRRGEFGL